MLNMILNKKLQTGKNKENPENGVLLCLVMNDSSVFLFKKPINSCLFVTAKSDSNVFSGINRRYFVSARINKVSKFITGSLE